jgi:ABC-2 type transport system ATP-binding protein
VLVLDEPTIGLDPQTRRHIWEYLLRLREQEQLTIFLTTQYLDEAENCDRIAIIDRGEIVALDTPDGLKRAVGGDLVTFTTADSAAAAVEVKARYRAEAVVQDGTVRFHVPAGDTFLPDFVRTFPHHLGSVSLERPSLDDVFITLTGHEIRDAELDAREQLLHGAGRWGPRGR